MMAAKNDAPEMKVIKRVSKSTLGSCLILPGNIGSKFQVILLRQRLIPHISQQKKAISNDPPMSKGASTWAEFQGY
jgi:hypothetical protein